MADGFEKDLCLKAVRVRNARGLRGLLSMSQSILGKRDRVTYSVVSESVKPLERRRAARAAARLSSGKIVDENDRFLTECTLRNRTNVGVRVKLARKIDTPKRIQLYDDQACSLRWAEIVWKNADEIGCKFLHAPRKSNPRLLQRLKQPFYAMQ